MLNLDLLLRKLGWGEKKFDETFFFKKKKNEVEFCHIEKKKKKC